MKQVEGKKIYSVSEVNYFAKQTLEQMVIWVEGEVSSFKKNPNWSFYYLDLKDERATLPCIASSYLLDELPEDLVGKKVRIFGTLSLYETTGKYQLRIQNIEEAGEGLLYKKLEELVRKLKKEGLFNPEHKKEIPLYPKKICLVTSYGSDAWQDFITHSVDKFPIIDLVTIDIRVQGSKSVTDLLRILPNVDKKSFDAVVITRGGGSIEDLAAFNNENVARTIFQMSTPTVVAIGHEANESLAEWVADRRASTPTDAANIVCAGYNLALTNLETLKYKLNSHANYFFSLNFQTLDNVLNHLQLAKNIFKGLPQKLESYHEALFLRANSQKQAKTQRLEELQRLLILLSPQNILERGFSITYDQNGKVLKSINNIAAGSAISVKLKDGRIKSKVTNIYKND